MKTFKNISEIKKELVEEYGSENARKLSLVRNPFKKNLLTVEISQGVSIETFNHVSGLGWIKL